LLVPLIAVQAAAGAAEQCVGYLKNEAF
jgi:hypothetical protein